MNSAAALSSKTEPVAIGQIVFHLRRNELNEAGSLLARALLRAPDDPAILHLSGTVHRLQNRPVEAEEYYRRSLASDRSQSHVHRDLGKLLAALGRLNDAIVEFRRSLRLRPDDADTHLCIAVALSRQGQIAEAETAYRQVVCLQPGHLVARLGLAETLCRLGHPREAEAVLRRITGVAEPALAAAIAYRLGIALQQQKKYSQALAQYDSAQAFQPDFPAVDFVRGETLQQIGQWERAALSFRKVLERHPAHANAGGSFALICALTGDFPAAREWSVKVLERSPAHGAARIALALTEIEDGNFAAAAEGLRDLLEGPTAQNVEGTAVAAGFAADAFDRRRRYAEAFAVSCASKMMLRHIWPGLAGTARMTDIARESTRYLQHATPWEAAEVSTPPESPAAAHIFVLGFLRSGTTLVETVLATDSNVVHADEVDFLGDAARTFLTNAGGLEQLATLSAPELTHLRANYWRAVRSAHFVVRGKIFIDKMPINTFRLPLIARLFPAAKVVFAIRDPRDVVLSCFRHHFDRTACSMEFLRLDDCANLYAAAMSFADVCRKKLPLDVLELRYENLVGDFDSTTRALCRFVGVDWSEALLDFRQAAETIDLRGASARQVRRGLYAGAAGHWRNYSAELAPVLPVLKPWVERFGYTPD
jgi:tetratricopeptide (TPR) repeat protein